MCLVGDKANHKPVLHLAMPLHMLAVTAGVLLPVLIDRAYKTNLIGWLSLANTLYATWFVVVFGVVVYIMDRFCLSHPFLLADNRHYTFYAWHRILQHPNLRLLLTPPYFISAVSICLVLREARGSVWVFIFIVAAVLTLVPAHLFELRYFTPAVTIAILNLPAPKSPQVGLLRLDILDI
jgi:alpha-1,2-glucosyltransferase